MNAKITRLRLLSQHERLRGLIQTCTRLAKLYQLEQGAVGADLDLALEVLRGEFTVHNEAETAAIRELLRAPSPWSTLLIDRMMEEHLAEHATFWDLLSGTRAEVAVRLDDLAEELEEHMDAEERTFLSPLTLHDDVIRVRAQETPAE